MFRLVWLSILALVPITIACSQDEAAPGAAPDPAPDAVALRAAIARTAAPIDGARIMGADATPGEWLTHGRTYGEQRFSPLAQIDASWSSIVMDGALAVRGMPAWREFISEAESNQIKGYVTHEVRLGHERGERRLVKQ